MINLRKKLLSEFLGTYFLLFAGTGAIVINHLTGSITHMGISIVFGLVVTALVYTFGHISGAHLNPAVTICFTISRDISLKEAAWYILSQLSGAVAASLTLLFLFGNTASLGATLPSGSWQQSFILEFILTFFLVIVIMGSAVHGRAIKSFAGIAIGATVALEAMFGGPISGASMNPARSIAPAIVSGNVQHLWVYIVATILGAVSASVIYNLIHE